MYLFIGLATHTTIRVYICNICIYVVLVVCVCVWYMCVNVVCAWYEHICVLIHSPMHMPE